MERVVTVVIIVIILDVIATEFYDVGDVAKMLLKTMSQAPFRKP